MCPIRFQYILISFSLPNDVFQSKVEQQWRSPECLKFKPVEGRK
jgi:hypothetical protein